MKKLLAILLVLIVLVFSFMFSPLLAENPVLYPDPPVLWLIAWLFFLIIAISLFSLYRTLIYHTMLRALLNFIIAITVVTYLLPIFFNVLNVAVFSTLYSVHDVIDVRLLGNKMVCGQQILTGSVPYTKIKNDTIRILCPINGTPETLFYKTAIVDKIQDASLVPGK